MLEPGWLTVERPSLRGHNAVERETGILHGRVSRLKGTIALMPGEYDVMFNNIPWPMKIEKGKTTRLNPGTVTVPRAHYAGHKIYDSQGNVIGKVSNTSNSLPLPPGNYVIEVDGEKIPFSLKEGDRLEFDRK